RCAHPDAVSSMEGRTVLVTQQVEGTSSRSASGVRLFRTLGDLLGRLQTLPADHGALDRPGGAWHHLSFSGGGRRQDIDALTDLLADAGTIASGPDRKRYEFLRERISELDDGEGLPQTLVHPDFSTPNVILPQDGGPVLVDWTGAGRGPRI